MEERRRSKRAHIEIDVEYQISKRQEWLRGTMTNLSVGGICLLSRESFGLSNVLDLCFIIPDVKDPIEVSGTIKWEDFDIDNDVYLVGIQFDIVLPKDRALIEKYVERETFVVMKNG